MPFFRNAAEIPKEPRESDDYPKLMNMIRAYFNQDYDTISEDPDVVVSVVKDENSPQYVKRLIDDIQRFLAKYGGSDPELYSALDRVFQPELDFYNMKDRGTREGLEKVIEILSNPPKTP